MEVFAEDFLAVPAAVAQVHIGKLGVITAGRRDVHVHRRVAAAVALPGRLHPERLEEVGLSEFVRRLTCGLAQDRLDELDGVVVVLPELPRRVGDGVSERQARHVSGEEHPCVVAV